jgi:hypothetical protein
MTRLLNVLLWRPAARWNLFWAGLGAFVGLSLLLLAVQLYADVSGIRQGQSNVVLLQKKVGTMGSVMGMLGADPAVFSPEEIAEFGQQPFVRSVSPVLSNRFRVTGELPQSDLYMYLFLQAVPTAYLDISPPEFVWQPGQREIPLILSKEFLSLYNLAAAPAIGTPPIPPSVASSLPFRMTLSGNGLQQEFPCRIVGFSQRLNTLLVPHAFLEHANATFGEKNKPTKQLVAFVDNPSGQDFQSYLQQQNWEVGRAAMDRVGGLAAVLMPVLGGIGAFVAILALLVYALNFRLLVAQASGDIRLLQQLGYRQKQLVQILQRRFAYQFLAVVGLTAVVVLLMRYRLGTALVEQGFAVGLWPTGHTWLLGAGLVTLYLSFIRWSITRAVGDAR